MSGVITVDVTSGEAGLRLDRWLRNRYPNLKQGKLQKLLRTGQIRVDGARAKANDRVDAGQKIRIPPNIDAEPAAAPQRVKSGMDLDEAGRIGDILKDRVLYMDDEVIALDKPPGLAVQGGSKTDTHIDGALDRLKMGADERPRLVHRLDRDTSGVLLLARSRAAAARIGEAFQARETRKIYWALVNGVPPHREGLIDAPLAKMAGKMGDRVRVDDDQGKVAKTRFRIIDNAGKSFSWLELEPFTGRTHQLRVHCQVMDTPIVGDPKYSVSDVEHADAEIARKLHLHARLLVLPRPGKRALEILAPMPPHMTETWRHLGFDIDDERAEIEQL
jgi:23S rRNA pseudouridine955/2504/2580 synthase